VVRIAGPGAWPPLKQGCGVFSPVYLWLPDTEVVHPSRRTEWTDRLRPLLCPSNTPGMKDCAKSWRLRVKTARDTPHRRTRPDALLPAILHVPRCAQQLGYMEPARATTCAVACRSRRC
jgi:hypothetical protein